MRKAIFIDRDGTLIKDIPYNTDPALISLEFYAAEMLQLLKRNNYLLIIISNQSGIARGWVRMEDVYKIHQAIRRKLLPYNVQLDSIYYCPHLPQGVIEDYVLDCNCRKPKPGMLLRAAKDFNIDMSNSWMVGDILNDVEAGNAAGCKTILIDNGNETEWEMNIKRTPTYIVKDLKEATEIILKHEPASV
jgi:D-glycero-D-manno-heptose 1,7-bisphosphate phosphatase